MHSRAVTPQKRPTTVRAGSIPPLVPIGAATLFIIIANVIFIVVRFVLPYPNSPWEAGIITDAWRMLHGQAVYAVGTEHATTMYGPLLTMLLAQIFRFTGLASVLQVSRLLSITSGIAVVAMLARVFGRDCLAFGVATALLLAANARTAYYFTEIRPDMDCLLFTTLALIVLYEGLESARDRPGLVRVLVGSALFVIAILFKQTAMVFTVIPALAMVGQVGTFSRRKILTAAIPIVAGLVTFGVIRLFVPGLWHFMVEVPKQYRVPPLRAGELLVQLLASLPLFALAFVHWLFTDSVDTWQLPRLRWLLAALVCTIPACIVFEAKEGGAANSLIPAFLSIGAFCAWRAPVAFELLRDTARPLPLRIVTGVTLAIMLFAQVYSAPGSLSRVGLKGGYGVKERALVITEARSLPGKVVSPDDPTIALIAKGYAGRTAVFEADAVDWDFARMQGPSVKELDSADYVIAMPGVGIVEHDKHLLTAIGFTKSAFRTTSTPVYELWHRTRQPGLPGS